MTITEIVEREAKNLADAIWLDEGKSDLDTVCRPAMLAVAKAVVEGPVADMIRRIGNEKWLKFGGDTQWGAAQQSAVTETVEAIGNAILLLAAPYPSGGKGEA